MKESARIVSIILFVLSTLTLSGCSSKKGSEETSVLTVEMRKNIGTNNPITFKDEIKSIEYIPLEITDDDASLLPDLLDICVSDEYIFISPGKVGGICQFDRRTGKFIRKFAKEGRGPGETQIIFSIYSDDKTKQLIVVQDNMTLLYSFDGEYITSKRNFHPLSFQDQIDTNTIAKVGSFIPFTSTDFFGVGVFTTEADTIALKKDWDRPDIIAKDISGLKDQSMNVSLSEKSLLFFNASNDTVFRLAKKGISPAFILDRRNSEESLHNALAAYSFEKSYDDSRDFVVQDFFETFNSFYVRAYFNGSDEMHIYQLDKQTGKTTAQISPVSRHELFGYDWKMQGIGIERVKGGLPLWVSKAQLNKRILIQYIQPAEILYLKEKGFISKIPPELGSITDDSNPIVVIYHL